MFDLGTLLRVPYVETEMGFGLSPDGGRIAFSWNPAGSWEIFEGSLRDRLKPESLTHGPGGKFHPRYSPDGSRLAYTVDFDGSERYHLVVRNLADGREIDLTPGGDGSLQAFFAWSPDSRQLAFISDRNGCFDIYLTAATGGPARLVFDSGYPAWQVYWSPDGKWLAVVAEGDGQDYATFIVPPDGGTARRIGDGNGPIHARDAAWSPDSTRLAFSSNVSGHFQIGIYTLCDGRIDWLTSGEEQKQHPAWSPDGKTLAYVMTRGATSWLVLHPLEGEGRCYRPEPGAHYLPQFTPDGLRVLFAFENPRHPTDLWSLTVADGRLEQLSHSLPAELSRQDFPMPEEVTYPGLDGVPVPALLYRPVAREPAPAVLLIHGGPDWHFEMFWYPLMTHLASRGWIVLAPNFRGSTGYGRDWQQASRFDYGGTDANDVTAGAHYLIQGGLADPKRIAVSGRSHGGYLTACCMTQHPELWAAGSAVVPFLNWFTNHAEIRPDLQHWDLENFGDPVNDRALWEERSPGLFIDRIQAPLQLICGRQDARCPISDSIAAHAELTRLGKPAELIIYEDEGHTFLKLENHIDSELRRVAFLAQVLERK